MKFTILGFSQKELVKLNITLDEALILRYFVDFKDTNKMAKEFMKDDMYYWINYDKLKEQLPILNVSKDRIYRKLKHLCKVGVLKHKTKRKGGVFSFYTLGSEYYKLITDSVKITEPSGENNGTLPVKITEPSGENNGTKDSSIKDSSIKNIYINIVEYLNKKIGTKYRATTKKTQQLINARLNEGFQEKDFYIVIDKKVQEWQGTKWEMYLTPITLFGTKFEGYLNQKGGAKNGNGNKSNKYNNKQNTKGEERAEEYDFSNL